MKMSGRTWTSWTIVVALLPTLVVESSARSLELLNTRPHQLGKINPVLKLPVFDLRGGASKSQPKRSGRTASLSQKTATGKKKVGAKKEVEKPSNFADAIQKFNKILPLTRIYMASVAIATLLGMVLGEEMTHGFLALDPTRLLYGMQIWRPLTAACFLGIPSINWLLNGYHLYEYGSSLERAYGTAQHLVFLLSQVVTLTILSILFGQPFFAQSVVTSMLHVLSRQMPYQKVRWLIFNVKYWCLPYCLMATDVLQAQSAMAAIPHVLGILSGHFYQFHKFIWPKVGGENWLNAPDMLVNRLDPDARRAKENVNKALKSRKRSKGRKLGSP